jgi:putative membrane-bound dehydrogenase-like protein
VIFLEGLPFPTGVTVWRDGLLICAAPDILFARDTDGDLRADQVERLFTGFATHNFQARVNSLEYGLDGWLYGSCGLFGGDITSIKTGNVIPLGQRDFRCNPDTGAFEAVSGNTQQGRVRNDEGDWFGCNNSVPLMHYPLDESSLRRNPFTAPPQIAVNISASPNPGRLYPISSQVLFALSGPPNSATAACGLGIWRDDLAGGNIRGNAFTCEPVNNLVHRQQLTSLGCTFTSHRAAEEQQQEFLASTDPWFRPVQVRTGPDGALWVVDMYRFVIEHPIWIPPAVLQTLDTRAGHDRGRLYRVLPEAHALRPIPDLSQLTGPALAVAMNSLNGTVRDLVQQLILWNRDTASRPALLELTATAERPEVRLQAACTADCLEPLPAELLERLARDPSPHVRRHAVRLAMPRLQAAPGLAAAIITAAEDPEPMVRLQAAAAAAALPPAQAGPLLAELLASHASDQFLATIADSSLNRDNVTMVFSSLPSDAPEVVQRKLLSRIAELAPPEAAIATLRKLAEAVAAVDAANNSAAVATVRNLNGLLDGWNRRRGESKATEALRTSLQPALTVACDLAASPAADAALRLVAIDLLGSACAAELDQSAPLIALLTPRSPVAVQLAAVTAMAQSRRGELAGELLDDWSARSPESRRAITSLLLQRGEWTERLLAAVESGTVPAAELDLNQRRQLLEHPREAIREAAARCLNTGTPPNRQEIIERYAAVFDEAKTSRGTAASAPDQTAGGLAAFRKHCANCHRLQDTGYAVGPDIANYAAKSPLALITAVLDPNQAVDPRYQSAGVVLLDGRTLTGLINAETDNSLTLLAPEGRTTQLLRSEIDQLRSTGKSLMPENLEQTVSAADLQLIWLWMRAQRQPPKQLDGNSPQLLELPFAGNVILNASAAEIRGGDITFELPFQNVGYWHGSDDHVRWTLRSETTRDVSVWAEWACHPDSAGNGFVIEIPGSTLTGTVDSSGGWDRYQLQHLGTLTLLKGDLELVVRPSGTVRGALADLRAIHLTADGSVPLARGMQQAAPAVTANASPAELAAWLLNDSVPQAEREAVLNQEISRTDRRPPEAVLAAMTQKLPQAPGSAEEYRRIPWIWRVAIGVGRSGTEEQFAAVLRSSLPAPGEPLQHWQAVVIGGGLINGVSLSGRWPHEVISDVIRRHPELAVAWQATLDASVAMSSDAAAPTGTRYDALRMVALLPWPEARKSLVPWLQPNSHSELQMGAVSGLGDVPHEEAAKLLVESFKKLTPANQKIALDALRRTPERRLLLEDARR